MTPAQALCLTLCPLAQVPFEQVPDLVATRRVLLRAGWAFVSRHEVASLVVSRFRAGLSHALALTARRWATLIADEEADRLTPLISHPQREVRDRCLQLPFYHPLLRVLTS